MDLPALEKKPCAFEAKVCQTFWAAFELRLILREDDTEGATRESPEEDRKAMQIEERD